MTDIEAVVDAVPEWRGRAIEIEPIQTGLTNANYRVAVDGVPVFVRIPGPATELLAIDRLNELHNTRAAAKAGVGPRVLHHLPRWNALVLEWLPGRTMSNLAFAAEAMPARIAESLRLLHGGPRFRDDFDMVRLTERYLAVIEERAIPVPDGYMARLPAVPRIEAALGRPERTVPCHNDLLAENYLDDGARLRIVDYEYSGNNDAAFELGNTAQELGFDEARQEQLCGAYFGEATAGRLARMRLQMIMSDVGWTLWAAIQARVSTIEYDFWGWALERAGRAIEKIDGPDFERWLRDAAADQPRRRAPAGS